MFINAANHDYVKRNPRQQNIYRHSHTQNNILAATITYLLDAVSMPNLLALLIASASINNSSFMHFMVAQAHTHTQPQTNVFSWMEREREVDLNLRAFSSSLLRHTLTHTYIFIFFHFIFHSVRCRRLVCARSSMGVCVCVCSLRLHLVYWICIDVQFICRIAAHR